MSRQFLSQAYYWLASFRPASGEVRLRERLLSACGAFLGLLISSIVSHLALGELNPWFIAPMGASAVLLFAVPASPLAQPWSIMGGNSIAAVLGVTAMHFINNSSIAFSVAVSVSIFVMMSLRCLHPPSGAVAMTAVLGGPAISALGYHFVIWPVAINSVLMLLIAILFNNLIGRRYPHQTSTTDYKGNVSNPLPSERIGITSRDVEEVIESHAELLEISAGDLKELVLEAQQHAYQRFSGNTRCQDIMSRNVLSLQADDSLTHALHLFEDNNLMSLPVLNKSRQLIGSLSVYHLMHPHDGYISFRNHVDGMAQHVYQVMEHKVLTVGPEQPIADLIPYFTDKGFHYLPVINASRQLLGVIGRADMIAALFEIRLSQQRK